MPSSQICTTISLVRSEHVSTECKVMLLLTHAEVTTDSSPAVYLTHITANKTRLPHSLLEQFLGLFASIYLYLVTFIRIVHCSKLSGYFKFQF